MGVSRPTEMTIRDLLQEELRKRGVTVVPEFSVSTPVGRLAPDMLLKNGAQYVVETKLGAETKLLDAMVRLYDYSKYVTEAKGAFAVLFPAELRQPWSHEVILNIAMNPKTEYVVTAIFKDLRPSTRFAGNLSEIADWMAGHVLRAPVVEADTGFAIRVLRDAVSYITASVRQLQGKELEDIFGGKTVFENILQYEEGRYPLDEMRQAATYLLVNQLLFYHVLSRVDASFPAVDEEKIGKPADLAKYFEPVLKRDYSSVFGFDVASRLPVDATEVVKKVVMVVKALAPEKIRHDLLGKVFHELIPFEIRKAVAAFYTNNEAAEILAQLAIDKPDAKVMDLAVGSGTLLVAAYRRKRELLQKTKGTIELEDHKRFLEQDLTGIDIMPFAAHLAVVHLSLQALLYETEKVRVAVWDSTELRPGQIIPAIWSELKAAYRRPTLDMFAKGEFTEEAYVTKGAITLEGVGGEKIPLEQADLIIMNPPFTRTERLPETYREQLRSRLKEYEDLIWGRVGLHLFFVFLADKFVKMDGRVALVLPATVLRIKSMRGARNLWAENYHIEFIITTLERAAFSEAAQFREILLIAKKVKNHSEKGSVADNLKCAIVCLKRLPQNLDEARKIAQTILIKKQETTPDGIYDDELLSLRVVTQGELKKNVDNMFSLISTSDVQITNLWQRIESKAASKFVKGEQYIKEESIAVSVTPANSTYNFQTTFFFISQESRAIKKHDLWVVKRVDKDMVIATHRVLGREIAIPAKALLPGFRRPSGTGTMEISDILDYMIRGEFPKLNELIEEKEKASKILKNVKKWEKLVKKANLLLSRRYDLSAPGTKHLAFYSSIPTFGIDMWDVAGFNEENAKIMTLWFNSSINILQMLINRTETRGAWMKLHQYQIRDSMIPNLRTLTSEERKNLLDLFNKLKKQEFPSILEQLKIKFPLRVEIDRAVLSMLGFGDAEIDRILDYLYPALANEIEQLKTLMQG